MGRILLIIVTFSTLASSVAGQSRNSSAIRRIDAYVRSVDSFVKRQKPPALVFADVSDYDQDKPKWQRFASEAALEKFRKKTETYTVAYNFRQNGRIVASNFTLFSPSGDWSRYVNHYFRPDGSAAKVTSELRTFLGDFIVVREFYFDATGKLLKTNVKYLDLTTKKPKKPTEDVLKDDPGFYKVGYFKRTSVLPFAQLIAKK